MKCCECRWYDDKHERLHTVPGAFGFCRKHKPISVPTGRDNIVYGTWPLVDKNDFCGEYREKGGTI